MAGLLNPGPPQDNGPVMPAPRDGQPATDTHQLGQGGAAQDDVVQDDVEPNVHPEEQAQYEGFVKDCLGLIYTKDQQVNPGILKMLDDDPSDLVQTLGDVGPSALDNFNPRVALAATAVVVVLEVVRRRDKAGEKPEGDIIFHGGSEVLEDLANLADKAGIQHYTQEDINAAFLIAQDIYRAAAKAAGLLDDSEAAADWGEVVDADRRGPEALESLLPGIHGAAPAEAPTSRAQPPDEGGA